MIGHTCACHWWLVQVLSDLAKNVAQSRELVVDRGLIDAALVVGSVGRVWFLSRVVHHVSVLVQFGILLDSVRCRVLNQQFFVRLGASGRRSPERRRFTARQGWVPLSCRAVPIRTWRDFTCVLRDDWLYFTALVSMTVFDSLGQHTCSLKSRCTVRSAVLPRVSESVDGIVWD